MGLKFLLGLFVLMVLFSFLKNTITKSILLHGVKALSGLEARLKSIDVGLIKTSIQMKEFQLLNPTGFKDQTMIDLPELYINYDFVAFLSGKVHLEELRLHLKELTVIKNEKGELNIDSLNVIQNQKGNRVLSKKEKELIWQIDFLKLKIEKVLYKDYSNSSEPKFQEFNVNIEEQYQNITNPQAVVSLILMKALTKTTLVNLIGLDLELLKKDPVGLVQKMTQDKLEMIKDFLPSQESK